MIPRRRDLAALAVFALAPGTLAAPAPASAHHVPRIEILSNRADLVSGGDVLIRVRPPAGTSSRSLRVVLRGRNVARDLTHTSDGLEGLVTGLRVGRNRIVARVGGPGGPASSRVVTNHPNGGPVFSGPQVQPWTCQRTAVDAQCNQPARYDFLYKPAGGGAFRPYDPENPPSDVATTTTDEGERVPFVIRIETGYQDRDQYKIAVLYDPAEPWSAVRPQRQWNHKVLVTHGSSCGVSYKAGNAPSVTSDTVSTGGLDVSGSSPQLALGRGFAVMSTALDHAGHNCNIVTQAESLVMAKERIVERYGEIRYTIGTGCSGGSLTQQQVANAYPGIYQGILPQCSYPDAISTGIQFADLHGLRRYFEEVGERAPQLWTPAQWGIVEGHVTHANAVAADEAFFKDATNPSGDCVAPELVYHPERNPGGVRCSLLDYMINVFGPRPESVWTPQERAAGRGFAGQPLGNVGVQYGLEALRMGAITPEQFVDLNHRIGGLDIDVNPVPERTKGDPHAVRNAYRSGAINEANNLDEVAIIDLRGPDPGIAHDAYRSWALRARLVREHGTHANHVIWFGPTPLIGDPEFTTEALTAMDRWLTAVEADTSRRSLARKIVRNRPGDVRDACDPDRRLTDTQCDAVTAPHRYGTPRTVAGDEITTDNAVCRLRPLERSEYAPVAFTDDQWRRLQEAFPTGVCDFAAPGIGQRDTVAWLRYGRADGSPVYGGRRLGRAPRGSGAGWSSTAFRSWLRGR